MHSCEYSHCERHDAWTLFIRTVKYRTRVRHGTLASSVGARGCAFCYYQRRCRGNMDPALWPTSICQSRTRIDALHHHPISTQQHCSQATAVCIHPGLDVHHNTLSITYQLSDTRRRNGGELPGDGGAGQYVLTSCKSRLWLTFIQAEALERCTKLSIGEQARSLPSNTCAHSIRTHSQILILPRSTSKTAAKS
jgi:hypothetical protein